MKRTIVMLVCAACALAGRAETTHSVGLQLGFEQQIHRMNAPKESNEDKNHLDVYPLNGAKLGFVYEGVFVKGLGLYAALNYSFTGHTSDWEPCNYTIEGRPTQFAMYDYRYKTECHTLDLNLELEYKIEIAGGTYLILYTGPSFQGIAKYSAKDFFKDKASEEEQETYLHVFGYNAGEMAQWYKRWNVTWGVGVGFQYKRYFVRGGYDFGIVNPYQESTFGKLMQVLPTTEPDRLTRGRFDNWCIKLGIYLWSNND